MKKYLLLFLIPVFIYSYNPNEDKKLILKKINVEIKIDGIIENVWSSADSVVKFFQLSPYYNRPPTNRTVAKVLTTDDALYCLMICYQKREDILAVSGVLDDYTGDIVSLMIDTFNDKQTAYKFAVNASGVRMDSRLLDDARNRDYSWDGIWFADSKIYNWGYVVEMKIPYKSIKYEKSLTEWGLDFDRWIPAQNEDLYWCEYEQTEGQRISKFGKLVFDNFQPTATGLNLEIYPVGLMKVNYTDNEKYKVDPDAGLDIFYNPSQKLTYQLTVNPDFAQIEADPFDFNISRYESYFDERRPFFTEGQEVFMPSGRQTNTGFYRPMELFYSRRIGKLLPDGKRVPLILGTKAFGRLGDWEYGGFLAMTDEVNYKNEDDIDTVEQRAYFGSGRIKKQVFGNSSIGLLFVGKQTKDNTYGVIDIDGAFRESNW
ncbi:MAG: carbohydrate binding family 9 domain-containing protein, partial [Ignavibacteriaceae bacterium]|nr:carbohydrate binding family 9 domain-containing protein [Ignavibacteriaceae bacterium]